jgi:hypothetical protein
VPMVFNQNYIGTMDYWDPAKSRLAKTDADQSSKEASRS